MKFCSVCEEEFADKFSFCPVDGTPLTPVATKVEDPSVTVAQDPSLTVSRDNQAPAIEAAAAYNEHTVDSEPVYAASSGASSALALRDEYHLTFLDDAGLGARLIHEFKDEYDLTWPEFKRDPFGF